MIFKVYPIILWPTILVILIFLSLSPRGFQTKHVEWIDSNYHEYVFDNPDRENLISSIEQYTKNKNKAKEYSTLILETSFRYSIDYWLIAAIIAKESSFRPKIQSGANAKGLMQVMPQWSIDNYILNWSPKNRRANHDLFDPEVNINYGVSILEHYINRYNDINRALAAYNGSKGSTKYPNAVLRIKEQLKSI